MFLVLSGYFITASLQRTRGHLEAGHIKAHRALGAFYSRRLLRILPPYGLFLVAGLLLDVGSVRQHLVSVRNVHGESTHCPDR